MRNFLFILLTMFAIGFANANSLKESYDEITGIKGIKVIETDTIIGEIHTISMAQYVTQGNSDEATKKFYEVLSKIPLTKVLTGALEKDYLGMVYAEPNENGEFDIFFAGYDHGVIMIELGTGNQNTLDFLYSGKIKMTKEGLKDLLPSDEPNHKFFLFDLK